MTTGYTSTDYQDIGKELILFPIVDRIRPFRSPLTGRFVNHYYLTS
jgi:hypothetical protein